MGFCLRTPCKMLSHLRDVSTTPLRDHSCLAVTSNHSCSMEGFLITKCCDYSSQMSSPPSSPPGTPLSQRGRQSPPMRRSSNRIRNQQIYACFGNHGAEELSAVQALGKLSAVEMLTTVRVGSEEDPSNGASKTSFIRS